MPKPKPRSRKPAAQATIPNVAPMQSQPEPPAEGHATWKRDMLMFLRKEQGPTAVPTVRWIPARLEPRFGNLYSQLMNHTTLLTIQQPNSEETELWHRILQRSPGWILAATKDTDEDAGDHTGASYYAIIKKRIQLAGAGEWLELYGAYIKDIQDKKAKHTAQDRTRTKPTRARVLETIVKRINQGNSKSAMQLIHGLPPVTPSDETVTAIQKLFVTAPLS